MSSRAAAAALTGLLAGLPLPRAGAAEPPPAAEAPPEVAPATTAAPDGAPLPDERSTAYRQFRSAFDDRRYADALPHALEVLRLTERQFGRDARQLANPLANVATTHYRLKDHGAAVDAYTRALAVLEDGGSEVAAQMIRPLQGLAAAYRGLGRDTDAIAPLQRALDLSRNRDGLFNPGQLELLRPLADLHMKLGNVEDAARLNQYAYTVAENAFGKEDARVLKPLDDYARWNENVGRYTAARLLHGRAVQIAEKAGGRGSLLMVDGLRGLARSFRLGYVYGEDEEAAMAAAQQAAPEVMPGLARPVTGPNPDGERALRTALAIVQSSPQPDPALLGALHLDLGDWYLTLEAKQRAAVEYREAWKAFAQAGRTEAMQAPALLAYRLPLASVARRKEDAERYERRDIRVTMTIGADGQARDLVASSDGVPESVERNTLTSLRRGVYRPRFEAGQPAEFTGFTHVSQVWVKREKAE
jgi:tetratricopeptide (TPR) repeat protein